VWITCHYILPTCFLFVTVPACRIIFHHPFLCSVAHIHIFLKESSVWTISLHLSLNSFFVLIHAKHQLTTFLVPSHLTTTDCYCDEVDHLPSSLTHLTISHELKAPVDHLPPSLTYLAVDKFNHPVDYLPSSLVTLKFMFDFNHAVDYLPLFLTKLVLPPTFKQPVDNLPSSLIHLKLPKEFQHNLNFLPPSLKQICFWN